MNIPFECKHFTSQFLTTQVGYTLYWPLFHKETRVALLSYCRWHTRGDDDAGNLLKYKNQRILPRKASFAHHHSQRIIQLQDQPLIHKTADKNNLNEVMYLSTIFHALGITGLFIVGCHSLPQ